MSGGSDPQTVRQVTQRPAYEQTAFANLYREAENLYQNYAPQYYPDSTVAPISRDTSTATNQLRGVNNSGQTQQSQQLLQAAGQQAQANVAGPDLFAAANRGQEAYGAGGAPGENPITQALVERTIDTNTQDWNRNVLPQLQSNQAAGNTYGGTRGAIAEGIAAGDLARANLDTSARLYESSLARDQQLNLQAAQLGGNLGAQQFGGSQAAVGMAGSIAPSLITNQIQAVQPLLQAGQIDQAYRQALLDDDRARFSFTQNLPYQSFNQYVGALSGIPQGTTSSSTTSPGPESGGLAGAIGGGIGGLGAAGALGLAGPAGWAVAGLGALAGSGILG